MTKKLHSYHAEHDSPFYKLRRRKRLAEIFLCSINRINELTSTSQTYFTFEQTKKNGTKRRIDAPRDDLKEIQRRIATLLHRIRPPSYLFAPVAGRSYVDNAAAHLGGRSFRLIDLEDFFPSCSDKRVTWFFGKRMLCSPDVTAVLRQLTTLNGCLPQGSPCSPILAYFSYIDMWEEINRCVAERNCKLSVYIDDVTISGESIPEDLVWNIKTIIHRFGHENKTEKERRIIDKPVEVTGVIVRGSRLLLPNRQHKKMHELTKEIPKAKPIMVDKIKARLRGYISQMRQVLEFRNSKM